MSANATVQKLIQAYLDKKKYVGMICAGSLAARTAKLPKQPITSHPSVRGDLEAGEYPLSLGCSTTQELTNR